MRGTLGAAIGAEAPVVAFEVADGKPARAVVLVLQALDDLGTGGGRPFEQGVGLVGDRVDRRDARRHVGQRLARAGGPEHHATAGRPTQLGVNDDVFRLAGYDERFLQPERLDEEADGSPGVGIAECGPDRGLRIGCHRHSMHADGMPTKVYLETGTRRVFASALDWPGWCRSGKDEEAALEALAEYAARYAVVANEASIAFPAKAGRTLTVVERLPGSATTDFGAPEAVATEDHRRLTAAGRERLAALVEASWTAFDRVVADAPAALRKGPRGGGRDRDAIVEHVDGAEAAYARKLGIRLRNPTRADVRPAVLTALREGFEAPEKGWPPRYAARRIAW